MFKMKKIVLTVIAISSLLFLGASCYKSSSNSNNTTNTSAPVATNQISISNFAFSPQTVKVTPGTKVTWVNNDSVAHTITSNDNKFNSTQLASGASFEFTFSESGTYNYHCSIHPSMTGQVIVQ